MLFGENGANGNQEREVGTAVDHEARKREIIRRSVELFAQEGYSGVTYQKIADSCGIARTILYKYFHSKGVIFNRAIWQAADALVREYRHILAERVPAAEKLVRLLRAVLKMLSDQRLMLVAVVDYLQDWKREGSEGIAREVQAHTIGLQRIVRSLLREGIVRGELKKLDVARTADLLYCQLEAAALRLTVTQNFDLQRAESVLGMTIGALKA